MAIGVFAGVAMAVLGCRYWSLVGLSFSTEIAGLLLTWSISRWRPTLPTGRSAIGPLLSFGARRTAGALIAALPRNDISDSAILQHWFSGTLFQSQRSAHEALEPISYSDQCGFHFRPYRGCNPIQNGIDQHSSSVRSDHIDSVLFFWTITCTGRSTNPCMLVHDRSRQLLC